MALNINKFCEALSRILSNKYGMELTVTAEKKEKDKEAVLRGAEPCP